MMLGSSVQSDLLVCCAFGLVERMVESVNKVWFVAVTL